MTKKEKLIHLINHQVGVDLTPHVWDRYSKRTFLSVSIEHLNEPQLRLIRQVELIFPDRFRIEENGGMGLAFWYGPKL